MILSHFPTWKFFFSELGLHIYNRSFTCTYRMCSIHNGDVLINHVFGSVLFILKLCLLFVFPLRIFMSVSRKDVWKRHSLITLISSCCQIKKKPQMRCRALVNITTEKIVKLFCHHQVLFFSYFPSDHYIYMYI